MVIAKALNDHLRALTDIADLAKRARRAEMADTFRSMLSNCRVFRGEMDTPQTDSTAHYGAYSPLTKNIHFDPWALAAAAQGGNASYQLANTALHEAAHSLGHNHEQPVGFLPGLGPLYSEDYFKDLNGGGDACVK